MGSYEDVLMDYDTTYDSIRQHAEISEDEAEALTSLGTINEALMNRWFGIGGDAFAEYASTIEAEIGNTIRFSDNSQDANTALVNNNEQLDDDRANSVTAGSASSTNGG